MTEWHEAEGTDVLKVHLRWWTSDSHLDLSALTLAIGLRLAIHANRWGRCEDGGGDLVNAAGDALSLAAMSRMTHASPGEVRKALYELCAVGTMAQVGASYRFPGLRKWQESPSAGRMRRHRSKL